MGVGRILGFRFRFRFGFKVDSSRGLEIGLFLRRHILMTRQDLILGGF